MSYESPVSRVVVRGGGVGMELEIVLFNTHEVRGHVVMISSLNGLQNNFYFLTYKL